MDVEHTRWCSSRGSLHGIHSRRRWLSNCRQQTVPSQGTRCPNGELFVLICRPYEHPWCVVFVRSFCLLLSAQERYDAFQPQPLPPLSAAVEARASKNDSVGPSRPQLPPLHMSPPRLSESATSPSSEPKQGGNGKDMSPPKVNPPHRGDRSGRGGGTSIFYASANDAQHQPQRRRRWRTQASSIHPVQGAFDADPAYVGPHGGGGGRRGPFVSQTQKGMLVRPKTMLQVLSSAADTDQMKRANSTSSTGSTSSINSCSTQSSFECD